MIGAPKFRKLRNWGGFRSIPKLDGYRYRKEKEAPFAPAMEGLRETFDLTNDREQEIARALSSDEIARRVMALLDKYPYGTVPEMLTLDYLDRKGERYKYQAQLFGGFRQGGLVPDFVVSRGGVATALLINGAYWHNLPGKKEKDASDKLRLINQTVNGDVITNAVIVWESRLVAPEYEGVLDAALQGIELGQ